MDLRLPFPKRPTAVETLSARLSERKKAKLKRDVERQIESFLESRGAQRPKSERHAGGWHFLMLGSAPGRVGVVESSDDLYLHADAVVMERLPADGDLIVPLMRELLELTAGLPESARLAIYGDTVFAMVTRRLTDLSEAELQRCIEAVMAVADSLDDAFRLKYPGTSRRREQ